MAWEGLGWQGVNFGGVPIDSLKWYTKSHLDILYLLSHLLLIVLFSLDVVFTVTLTTILSYPFPSAST